MSRNRLLIWVILLFLTACSSAVNDKGTIGQLRNMHVEIIEDGKIEGGLDKAMESYQRFLQETPDSTLAPEAIRRLADLKIEKEYGTLTEGTEQTERTPAAGLTAPEQVARPVSNPFDTAGVPSGEQTAHIPIHDESETDFERRTTEEQQVAGTVAAGDGINEGGNDLERANAREAIELYMKLLHDYPLYDRNDQVLYQMSRAYEELGQIEEAMAVMERMVRDFPGSRYIDEVQFRRAEYFFTHRRYLDAEDAYTSIVNIGVSSSYYGLALYKLGWTFYKQELYDDALDRFITLLDYKVSVGYDFAQTEDEQERKRMEDTFRVISLSFSNLGGVDSIVDYFSTHGKRSYEDKVYANLAEFYFDKRRYADASAAYKAFVKGNPFHKMAPNFHMRIIEIHAAGGFPTLVLDSKKAFAMTYGLKAEYWKYFAPDDRQDVLGYLKTNLTDLANHYHACYQDPRQAKARPVNFKEALHWYREFLASFPKEGESPAVNYQLADLLLENESFDAAAVEYEKTAYGYPSYEKSSEAGYAAVYSYRQHLGVVEQENKDTVRMEVVRSSLQFAETFPQHEKAAVVLGAAADDLYGMEEYEQALAAANKLLETFPDTDVDVIRAAWLVIGHSSYELKRYSEAETAYQEVLALLPAGDKTRDNLVDNLAAAIYKQGEQANTARDYRTAADHFLRVGRIAPTSKIRANAEYDGATALIQLKDWNMAAAVLTDFRKTFPGHEMQPEVTKKIAYVYRENNQLSLAAGEYERIERESRDDEIRQESLMVAAELYIEDGNSIRALEVYRRYTTYFPQPVEVNLETRNKIAEILKEQNDRESYLNELRQIVTIDSSAGSARTPRTRYLAAKAALVLAEPAYDRFAAVKLTKPFEDNLRKKRDLMKKATETFSKLLDYEIGEVTAAATFYLAEIYAHFNKALMTSERPEGLTPLELEQYELAIEEQAYPFEEKAIAVHEDNIKLISRGVYNEWIDKSLQKLAEFVPARYAKPEESSGIVTSLDTYVFVLERPAPPASPITDVQTPITAAESSAEQVQVKETARTAHAEQVEASVSIAEPEAGATLEPPTESEIVEEEAHPSESGLVAESEPPSEPEPGIEPEPVAEPEQMEETIQPEKVE